MERVAAVDTPRARSPPAQTSAQPRPISVPEFAKTPFPGAAPGAAAVGEHPGERRHIHLHEIWKFAVEDLFRASATTG